MGSQWFYSIITKFKKPPRDQRDGYTPSSNEYLVNIFKTMKPPKRYFISIDDDRPRRRDHPVADWWPGWLIVEYVWNVRKHVSSSCRLFRSLTKHRSKVLNPKDLSVNLWSRINTSWHINQIVKSLFQAGARVIVLMTESAYLHCFAKCLAAARLTRPGCMK